MWYKIFRFCIGAIFVFLIVTSVIFHNRIHVEYLVWSDDYRKEYLESSNDLNTIFPLIDRATRIHGYKGYEILSFCYIRIAKIADKQQISFTEEEKGLIRRSFGGYTNLHYGGSEYKNEEIRYNILIGNETSIEK